VVVVRIKLVADADGRLGVMLQVDEERWLVMPPEDARALSRRLDDMADELELLAQGEEEEP
jgi:hypothetical protein